MTAVCAANPAIQPPLDAAWQALAGVEDPETGVGIVDLGLVYTIDATANAAGAGLRVTLTLTSDGCPAGDYLIDEVRAALAPLPGGAAATIDLVFDPPWTPARITEAGRRALAGG